MVGRDEDDVGAGGAGDGVAGGRGVDGDAVELEAEHADEPVGIANAVGLAGVARNAVDLAVARDAVVGGVPGIAVGGVGNAVGLVDGVVRYAAVERVVGNGAGIALAEGKNAVELAGVAEHAVVGVEGIAVAEGKNAVELAGVAEHAVVGVEGDVGGSVVGLVDLRTVGGGGNAVEHGRVGAVVDDVEDADELGVW